MTLSRLLRVILGLLTGMVGGCVALVVLLPLASDTLLAGTRHFFEAVISANDPGEVIRHTTFSLGRLLALLLAAPVIFIGLIGEITGWRSRLWLICGTALITATIPFLMRSEWQQPAPGELRIAACLGIVGAITGLIYWLIAGKSDAPDKV